MARLPRVISVGGVHHVTQRGNGRRFILETDADRHVYMELLKQSLSLHKVAVMGYCLMSNHVHLLLIPEHPDTLGQFSQACPWSLRILLERHTSVRRSRLAGQVLLLSAR